MMSIVDFFVFIYFTFTLGFLPLTFFIPRFFKKFEVTILEKK